MLLLDGDTVFLRPFIAELLSAAKESELIAMAHERGSTGINHTQTIIVDFCYLERIISLSCS